VARPDLRVFLERSLALLASEAPGSYERLCHTLVGRRVCVDGDGQRFALRFEERGVDTLAASGTEDIFAGIDRSTILALVDGAMTLDEALRDDRLVIRAEVAHAATAFDGLSIYLRGAIRSVSFPMLLAEFRSPTGDEEPDDDLSA
jgi:hypothetical protein